MSKRFSAPGPLARLLGARADAPAVDAVSLQVPARSVLGVVGESGSGKSTLAHIMVGLLDPSPGGAVLWGGTPRDSMGRAARLEWQRRVQIVFQDTGGALNPRKSIARCLTEVLALAGVLRTARGAEAARLLALVGLGPETLPRLPHELSGGQRQRVGIARALAMQPHLLVADEPVASLDVSLQAQVVTLLQRLTRDLGLTLVFISHDLALVRAIATDVAVMHRGRVVEQGPAEAVFAAPMHPYTRLLLDAVPRGLAGRGRARDSITRDDPPLDQGCHFRSRCPRRAEACTATPVLSGGLHRAACFFPISSPNRDGASSSLSLGTASTYGSGHG